MPASKKEKLTDAEQVELWINNSKHPMIGEVKALRKIIKGADKNLSERIKWNAPSYYFKEDVVTFGPYHKGKVLLVFHHPHVVKIKSEILQGDYNDRRLAYFENMADIKKNKKEIERVIKEIVSSIK